MVIYPLNHQGEYNNESLIDICALVGIICFMLGTYISKNINYKYKQKKILKPDLKISYSLYWIIIIIFLSYMVTSLGISVFKMVINGTITANELTFSDSLSTGNLSIYLMNLMIPFLINIWMVERKKGNIFKPSICLIVFVVISILFGYTRLFLICALLIILFFELRYTPTRKQAFILSLSFLCIVFLMVLLNFMRYIGTGNLSQFSEMFNLDYVFESTDFGASYKWFNELINYDSPYIFPLTYLKPIFVFIPRSIWPNKPEPISLDILKMIDPALADSGYSTAGNSVLGEGYAVLGWLGIVLFPLIWGIVCTSLDKYYYKKLSMSEDIGLWNISYYFFTTFIILSCQRGDWSQYMIIIIWLFIVPLYFISRVKVKL